MLRDYKTVLVGECVSTKRQTHHAIKLSVIKKLIKRIKYGRATK